MDRQLYQSLWEELSQTKPMVFLSGPRQSGKTTLAKSIAAGRSASIYLMVPAVQLVNLPGIARRIRRGTLEIAVLTASQWLSGLP
jgi:AAA+ ATPase superfamily predicted ATPase